MSLVLTIAALLSSAPFLPGDVITYEHGEGLVAGDAKLNDRGYWMTEYSFGPVGQSPVEDYRASIIQSMLDGETLAQPITVNKCKDGMCFARTFHTIEWDSKCSVRDTYAYQNMDAVHIEWECNGTKDGFNIVDFENGVPTQLRYFGPDRLIWVKGES